MGEASEQQGQVFRFRPLQPHDDIRPLRQCWLRAPMWELVTSSAGAVDNPADLRENLFAWCTTRVFEALDADDNAVGFASISHTYGVCMVHVARYDGQPDLALLQDGIELLPRLVFGENVMQQPCKSIHFWLQAPLPDDYEATLTSAGFDLGGGPFGAERTDRAYFMMLQSTYAAYYTQEEADTPPAPKPAPLKKAAPPVNPRPALPVAPSDVLFTTDNLIMHEWRPQDSPEFFAMCQDPGFVGSTISSNRVTSLQVAERWVHVMRENRRQDGFCLWAVRRKSDGFLGGILGFRPVEVPHEPGTLAMFVARSRLGGESYRAEACGAMIRFALQHVPNMPPIRGVGDPRQPESASLVQKLGFEFLYKTTLCAGPVDMYTPVLAKLPNPTWTKA